MTEHAALFEKMSNIEKLYEKQTEEMADIKKALTDIAVQGKEINHLNEQINALWRKYDMALGSNGIISEMRTYQASCPRDNIKRSINQLWTAISLIVALIGALKLLV